MTIPRYISKKAADLLDTDKVRCMRCGRPLDQAEIDEIRKPHQFPSCDPCWPEVNAELALNRSMYPNTWWGHAWRDCENLWHVEIAI